MTDRNTNVVASWRQAVAIHLCLVVVSFVITLSLAKGVPLMPGEALEFMACVVLVFHAVAAVVGFVFRKVSVLSCAVVFGLAFLPGGCEGVSQVRRAYNMAYVLPFDRFQDHLGPVPASVNNLHFVPLEESITPNLMFQFDIAASDLDDKLKQLNMSRVDPNAMRNPKDFFQHSFYMP